MTEPAPRLIRLRYAGRCHECHVEVAAGTRAAYERETKFVTCTSCLALPGVGAEPPNITQPPTDSSVVMSETRQTREAVQPDEVPPVHAGTAGASALRMYEEKKARREARVRGRFPRLGRFLLALFGEPQDTQAWAIGARGEEVVGAMLDVLTARGVLVLHDRHIPGGRGANIDHIAVAASGVFVIDAKRYKGVPRLRVAGGLFRPRIERLFVGGHDRSSLVAGVHKQVSHVTRALEADTDVDVPVVGRLCFVEADWPLLARSFTIQRVEALSPKALRKELLRDGALSKTQIRDIHRRLAAAFPEA